jgi:glycosyltransferase involved in cell wall biosynthesis
MTKGAGLLFPHGDDKALADVIQQLHDDASLYERVAGACYEKARLFDISKTVEAYNAVYVKLKKTHYRDYAHFNNIPHLQGREDAQ